jgi:hypothetical protein
MASQPDKGRKYGRVPQGAAASSDGAAVVVVDAVVAVNGVLDGEAVVGVDGDAFVIVGHDGGVVSGGGVWLGM